MFALFDSNADGKLSLEEIRRGMHVHFGINLTATDLQKFGATEVDERDFQSTISNLLRDTGRV